MKIKERYRIIGINCPSCILSINRSLKKLGYVIEFNSDPATGEAVIVYDGDKISTRDIVKAIRDAGYDVEKREILLMTNAGENTAVIEKALRTRTGVIECSVSPLTGVARIIINPYGISEHDIIKTLERLGFRTEKISREHIRRMEEEARRHEKRELYYRVISFLLGIFLVLYYGLSLVGVKLFLWNYHDIIGFIIASVVLILNKELIIRGLKSLFLGSPVMDSLIALSSTTTFVYSVIVMTGLISGGQTYFEASAGVLGFVSMGEYIESRLRARAGEALKKLMELQRGKVRVLRGEKFVEVDSSEVKVGDVVEVRAGERILVDGVVVEGAGYVDESTFTGEPLPVKKSAERMDPVLAGTILREGYIRVRVTRVGEDTSLAHIIEYVRNAQMSKPEFQKLADRIVGVLTWLVIGLSIATFIYWVTIGGASVSVAVMFAASVLAITCPCPLGIAIPLVVAITVGKAARHGLLIRDSRVFEKMLMVNMFGFDKTGTLTHGEPVVEEVIPADGIDTKLFLEAICVLEKRSEHVLGQAIRRYCLEKGIEAKEPDNYEHLPGLGIIGSWNGLEIAIGSEKMIREFGVKIPKHIAEKINGYRSRGKTVVMVLLNHSFAGSIVIGDKIRPESKKVIEYIRGVIGAKTILITGDNRKTAEAVARELGIDIVRAELRPEDKAELIKQLISKGERIAYVGDGINDAIAITESFLGIAMGRGADIAKEAGEVIITNDKLTSLIDLHKLSKIARKKMIQNIIWAFIYNGTLIPVAMGALYSSFGIALRPEFAALAMMASDISVILNSLTILRSRI